MPQDSNGEILRMRDRLHSLQSDFLGLRYQVDGIREWRAEIRTVIEHHTRQLAKLERTDEIAEAVAEKIKKERHLQLTVGQKLAAFIVGAVALAASIKGLIS